MCIVVTNHVFLLDPLHVLLITLALVNIEQLVPNDSVIQTKEIDKCCLMNHINSKLGLAEESISSFGVSRIVIYLKLFEV
jgi:hypothetical protein